MSFVHLVLLVAHSMSIVRGIGSRATLDVGVLVPPDEMPRTSVAKVSAADLSWTLPLSAVPAPMAPLQVHGRSCGAKPVIPDVRAALTKMEEWAASFRLTRAQYQQLRHLDTPILCQKGKPVARM